jgi:hypothetical protein
MRSVSVLAVLAAVVCLAVPAATAAAHGASGRGAEKPRVTFVGDSIAASLDYVASARRLLSRGFRMRFDLEVCRRLATTSCSFQGEKPETALEVVDTLGQSVGDVLIVNVGYNEGSYGYSAGMHRVVREALAQGARGVVWVTLRETRDIYRATNAAIRREAKRWDELRVADWATYSRGQPWFREDGLHLNSAGATSLARLVRASVLSMV